MRNTVLGEKIYIFHKSEHEAHSITLYADGSATISHGKNGEIEEIEETKFGIEKNKHINNTVEMLINELYAKNILGMSKPTSTDFISRIEDIPKEYIMEIFEKFKEKSPNNESLINAINNNSEMCDYEKNVTKSTLIGKYTSYRRHTQEFNITKNESQVSNKNYTGPKYTVEWTGTAVTITNESNNTTVWYNVLDKIKNDDPQIIEQFLKIIKELPAEVLEDLYHEDTKLEFKNIIEGAAGVYRRFNNKIELSTYGADSIVHEIGHAIDLYGKIYNSNKSNEEKFKKIFEEEVKAFEAAGNKRNHLDDTKGRLVNTNINAYCTTNPQEMFAECYSYLITGISNHSTEILETYFPKCIQMTKELLQEIRKKSDWERQ